MILKSVIQKALCVCEHVLGVLDCVEFWNCAFLDNTEAIGSHRISKMAAAAMSGHACEDGTRIPKRGKKTWRFRGQMPTESLLREALRAE